MLFSALRNSYCWTCCFGEREQASESLNLKTQITTCTVERQETCAQVADPPRHACRHALGMRPVGGRGALSSSRPLRTSRPVSTQPRSRQSGGMASDGLGFPGWRMDSAVAASGGSRPVVQLPSAASSGSGRGAKRQRIERVAVKREPQDGTAAAQARVLDAAGGVGGAVGAAAA
eukprot:COSAG02_NODE_23450_length_718_cov_1.252019_2_plen_174_part_01